MVLKDTGYFQRQKLRIFGFINGLLLTSEKANPFPTANTTFLTATIGGGSIMQKTNIEWADFTHNPVVGCNCGCPYCYAKSLNDRFKFIPNWNEPQFFPERLNFKVPKMPAKRNRIAAELSPDKPIVFMNSMWDVAGFDGRNRLINWSRSVLAQCCKLPEANFYFVSKRMWNLIGNESRKIGIEDLMPNSNLYFGFTMNREVYYSIADDPVEQYISPYVRTFADWFRARNIHVFANIEPLHGSFEGVNLSMFEFVIVGAETGNRKGKIVPTLEMIQSIKHDRIYYKDSILKILEQSNER